MKNRDLHVLIIRFLFPFIGNFSLYFANAQCFILNVQQEII